MRPTHSLVSKELAQTQMPVFWLAIFSIVTIWSNLTLMTQTGFLSYLSLASLYAMPTLVIVTFILSHQIVVREYRAGTQKFIDSLPATRLHIALVKFGVGLLLSLVFAFIALAAVVSIAGAHERVDQWFQLLLSTRVFFYTLTLWSWMFALSLLGRLQVPVIGAVIVFFLFLDVQTTFELDRFGPMALINNDLFTSERSEFPTGDVLECIIMTVIALGLAWVLLFRHEGNLVERLATPMTRGEIIFLVILAFMGLSVYTFMNEDSPEPVPYIDSDHVFVTGRITVSYLDPEFEGRAESLGNYLNKVVSSVNKVAKLPDEFIVRIVLSPMADRHEFSTTFMDKDKGLLVTANFSENKAGFDEYFSAYLVHQVLLARSGRATLEPRHAMTDGFSLWVSLDSSSSIIDMALLQALYVPETISATEETVRRWDQAHDVLGDSLGLSFAYSLWWAMDEQIGRDSVLAFAAREFGRQPHNDTRDWIADWLSPLAERYETATGHEWRLLIQHWSEALAALHQDPAYVAALNSLPRADVSFEPGTTDEGLDIVISLDKPIGADNKCYVTHGRIVGFDAPTSYIPLKSEKIEETASTRIEYGLAGFYGRGSRITVSVECEFDQFPIPVRLGNTRITLQ